MHKKVDMYGLLSSPPPLFSEKNYHHFLSEIRPLGPNPKYKFVFFFDTAPPPLPPGFGLLSKL